MTDLSDGLIYGRFAELALKVQKLEKRLDILESKPKQPVDHLIVDWGLVKEALAVSKRLDFWRSVRFIQLLAKGEQLLEQALGEEQDAETE